MNVIPLRFCWLALFTLLVGCAHPLQFRVVDASSGNVLQGADVKRRKVTSFSYLHRTLCESEVGSTGPDGMIIVPRVSAKDVIHFDAPGYRGAAAGLAEKGTVRISWALPPPMTPWTPSRQIVTNSNGTIVIPLLPVSSTR